jgi:ABC-type amino acid transport substrate-binding protein
LRHDPRLSILVFMKYSGTSIATAAFALALLAPVGLSAQAIRMAWFTLPPHVFAPIGDGPPTGPAIALFEAIAARMGYEVRWVGPLPLSRIDLGRESGELNIDGGILTIKTPELDKQLLYPSRPFFASIPCLGLRADNPLRRIESIRDIDGYRIGFVKALQPIYPTLIAEHRDRLVLDELSGDDWTTRNILKLLKGRLDAVFELNRYSLSYAAAMAGVGSEIKILLLDADPGDHYFVFHKTSPRAQALLDAYERAVAGFKFDYEAMVEAEIARRAAK